MAQRKLLADILKHIYPTSQMMVLLLFCYDFLLTPLLRYRDVIMKSCREFEIALQKYTKLLLRYRLLNIKYQYEILL